MNDDALFGAWCLSAYLHNTSGEQFARDVHGDDAHPRYLAQYAQLYGEWPTRAIGKLDADHFRKLAAIAVQRHGDAARIHLPIEGARTYDQRAALTALRQLVDWAELAKTVPHVKTPFDDEPAWRNARTIVERMTRDG